jgi:hypothetical protein
MELLIVHRDAELGEQLVQMVKDYTRHECDFAGSHVAAIDWGRRHARCGLLITQLDGDGLDGLALGAALSEIFPGLQTLFLPPYSASAQRLQLSETKVFPEPIDGEGLLNTIERATNATAGAPDLFHVVDVIQMCCLSGRSGAVQMVKENKSGIVFLRSGKLVHAETTAERGAKALRDIVAWEFVEFAYDKTVRPPVETLTAPWDQLIIEIVGVDRGSKVMERTQRLA